MRTTLEQRRRDAQRRLAEANKIFSAARALAPSGDADARERAQEALVAARIAREELQRIADEEREHDELERRARR
jgi:hypothetical protein